MKQKDRIMELLEKYPLAIETIKSPVRYEAETQTVWDTGGLMICDIKGWGKIQFKSKPQQRQDEIGNLIADLLNIFQKEVGEFPSQLHKDIEETSCSMEEPGFF